MTFDAVILHADPGKRQWDRLEVPFLASGREWPGYVFTTTYRGQLIGSFLKEKAKSRERVRLTTEETTFGIRITWAERIEQEVAS